MIPDRDDLTLSSEPQFWLRPDGAALRAPEIVDERTQITRRGEKMSRDVAGFAIGLGSHRTSDGSDLKKNTCRQRQRRVKGMRPMIYR